MISRKHLFSPARRLGSSGMGHLVAVLAFVVAFALVGTWVVVKSHADAVHPTGSVAVHSKLANLCLDDRGDSAKNASGIDVFTCNGTNAQDWLPKASAGTPNLYVLQKLGASGNVQGCLDVQNGGKTDKDKVVLTVPCSAVSTQYWKLTPAPGGAGNELESNGAAGNSGFCLADPNKGPSGSYLQVSPCNGQPQQLWSWAGNVASSSTGSTTVPQNPATGTNIYNYVTVRNALRTGMCMDDLGSSKKAGAVVDIFNCNNTGAQHWSFVPRAQGNGYTVRVNGLCMTAVNGGDENRDFVQLGTCNPAAGNDSWTLVKSGAKTTAPGSVVTIRDGAGYCLTDYNGSSVQRFPLEVFQCNGNKQQSWAVN